MGERACAALLYHHVGPPRRGIARSLTVRPDRFARQMHALARAGYRGVSAAQWRQAPVDGLAVVLTFDDGYADLVDHALPTLERLGFTATVFVVAGLVGGTNAWDEDRAEPVEPVDADPADVSHDVRLMSETDLRRWTAAGMDVGAHGMTHADLTAVDTETAVQEVRGSKESLEALLGSPVVAFAYPYGNYDDGVRATVASHFSLAFGVEQGLNAAAADPFALRRTMIQPADTAADVRLRARLGWSPIERARTWAASLRP